MGLCLGLLPKELAAVCSCQLGVCEPAGCYGCHGGKAGGARGDPGTEHNGGGYQGQLRML